MVGFQNLARPHYAEPTVLTQGIEHDTFYATYVMDSSMAWVIRSGYTDANGKPVEIDYQACTNDTAGNEYDQRSDESDVDFYVRQKAFLAQLDADYRECVLAQGVDHYETWYHSVDQVRRFQFTEAALVLILSGLFLLPALWVYDASSRDSAGYRCDRQLVDVCAGHRATLGGIGEEDRVVAVGWVNPQSRNVGHAALICRVVLDVRSSHQRRCGRARGKGDE